MKVEDARKVGWKEMQDKPAGKKLHYLWSYYKWYAIVIILVAVFLVSYFGINAEKQEILISGVFVNAVSNSAEGDANVLAEELAKDFVSREGYDLEAYSVELDCSLRYEPGADMSMINVTTIQQIMAYTSGGMLNFVSGDMESLKELAYMQIFHDLRDVLPENRLEELSQYILYIDMEVVRKRTEMFDQNLDTSDIVLPDCRKPEDMVEPVPVLMYINQADKLDEIYPMHARELIFGFTGHEKKWEITVSFFDYLMD